MTRLQALKQFAKQLKKKALITDLLQNNNSTEPSLQSAAGWDDNMENIMKSQLRDGSFSKFSKGGVDFDALDPELQEKVRSAFKKYTEVKDHTEKNRITNELLKLLAGTPRLASDKLSRLKAFARSLRNKNAAWFDSDDLSGEDIQRQEVRSFWAEDPDESGQRIIEEIISGEDEVETGGVVKHVMDLSNELLNSVVKELKTQISQAPKNSQESLELNERLRQVTEMVKDKNHKPTSIHNMVHPRPAEKASLKNRLKAFAAKLRKQADWYDVDVKTLDNEAMAKIIAGEDEIDAGGVVKHVMDLSVEILQQVSDELKAKIQTENNPQEKMELTERLRQINEILEDKKFIPQNNPDFNVDDEFTRPDFPGSYRDRIRNRK